MSNKIELLAGHWTLAGDTYPNGPTEVSSLPFRDRVEAAAAAGYTGLGIVHQDLVAVRDTLGFPEMRRICGDNGIVHFEVEFLADWFDEGEKRAQSDRVRKDLLEAAAELKARDIKVGGKFDEERCDVPRYAEAFASLCEDAEKAGTTIAIEVLPFTNIRDLKVSDAIISKAGHESGGLCIDIWHMARGAIPYEEVAKLPTRYVKSVELDDGSPEIVGTLWNDTLHHRLLPGEGAFRPADFVKAIQATGFDSFWSVEILSKDHRALPLKEQAKRSFDSAMALFR
ncbi:MAG TPA: TIM barrel protein [Roseiarcus sp.]|nr:TIM barrel protein [Roseiarcus sp.]